MRGKPDLMWVVAVVTTVICLVVVELTGLYPLFVSLVGVGVLAVIQQYVRLRQKKDGGAPSRTLR